MHRIQRDANKIAGGYFHFQCPVGTLRQTAFQLTPVFTGGLDSQPDLLPNDAFEIARFRQPAFDARRTDFESVAVLGNGIFLIEQFAQAFGDELTIAMGDTARFIDIYAQEARVAGTFQLDFDQLDICAHGGAFTEFGDPFE